MITTEKFVRHSINFELDSIKPKVDSPDSDKYSRNLYNFVRSKNKRYGIGIFCQQKSFLDGSFEEFDYRHVARPDVYYGFVSDQWLTGCQLNGIPCENRNFYAIGQTKNLIDITDWFWSRYIEIGRCIFDPKHDDFMRNTEGRWTYSGKKSRTCNWCGMVQGKIQVIRKTEQWKNMIAK